MHAVIRTGGKQYRVAQGDVLRVESLAHEPGSQIELTDVLLIGEDEQVVIGNPLVEGGVVTAQVCGHGRGDKINVIKFKRRKKYRRKQGHRQNYTEIKVVGITGGGVLGKADAHDASDPTASAAAPADVAQPAPDAADQDGSKE